MHRPDIPCCWHVERLMAENYSASASASKRLPYAACCIVTHTQPIGVGMLSSAQHTSRLASWCTYVTAAEAIKLLIKGQCLLECLHSFVISKLVQGNSFAGFSP